MKIQTGTNALKKPGYFHSSFYHRLIFLLTTVVVFLECSKPPDTVLGAYEKAHNSHNVTAELSCYADNISFEIKGVWIKTGLDKMWELAVWDSTLDSHLDFDVLSTNGDTVLCKVTEDNAWFKAIGLEHIVHDSTIFITNGGKIEKIIAYSSDTSSQKISKAIQSIVAWSQQAGDTTIFGLISGGEFIYSRDAAKKWLALLKKWNTSK